MKKVIVASIITLSVFNISYAEKISAEFRNAKFSTVVEALSQVSNINVIWDKDASAYKDKMISLSVRKPIEAEKLFKVVLLENGLIPVKEDDFYKLKVADEYIISVPPEIITAFGKDVFDNLVAQTKKYVSRSASVNVDDATYTIVVKDDKDSINRLKSVLTAYLDSVKKQSDYLSKVQEKEGQFVKKEFDIPYDSFKSIEDKIADNLGMYGKYEYDKSKGKLIVFDSRENMSKILRIVGKVTHDNIETKCFYTRGLDVKDLISNIKERDLSDNGTVIFKSKETTQTAYDTSNTSQNNTNTSQNNTTSKSMVIDLPKVCITDDKNVIDKIKHKYADYLLDKPYQIVIEARIVQINTDDLKDLGIQWGGLASNIDNNNTKLITGGGSASIKGGQYAVDFPATYAKYPPGFAIGFSLGGLQNFLDVKLSALESKGKSKLLSKPQIATLDGETAEISQGYEIPYSTAVATGGGTIASVLFKKAVLKLSVTPRTTADGHIVMDVNISQDSPDFDKAVAGNPPIQTKTITSKIVAKDGDVVAIGGILETMEGTKNSGVPGLMNIPVFGSLFKENSKQSSTSELVIFLSPKIVYE
jgi:type IV pilus assembly protein PilQ